MTLAEALKRIAALEARVAALEAAPKVVHEYHYHTNYTPLDLRTPSAVPQWVPPTPVVCTT